MASLLSPSALGRERGVWRRIVAALRPEEAAGLLFALVLGVLLLLFFRLPRLSKTTVDLGLLVLAAVVLLLAGSGRTPRWGRASAALRDWLPFLFCVLVYENLHDLVPLVNPGLADPVLSSMDRAVFGVDVAVWSQRFISSGLTRIMEIGYSSYYLLAPVFAGILYVSGERDRFRHVMLGVVFGLYVGYVGYVLVPTIGPRYYQAALFSVDLKGEIFQGAVVARLLAAHGGVLPRDCFPSLHTATAVTVLGFVIRYRPRLAVVFGPVVVLLLASTIYLRYHYAVDLAAGALLGGFMLWAAPRIDGWWGRGSRDRGPHAPAAPAG